MPEVVGDAAELVDADDPGAVAAAVRHVLESGTRRGDLRRAGLARAAELSWDRCAAAYAAIYREVAGH